jgi:aspartate aminotransferase-like enzyme
VKIHGAGEAMKKTARFRSMLRSPDLGFMMEAHNFRIANMGDIRPQEMQRFTGVLDAYLAGVAAK